MNTHINIMRLTAAFVLAAFAAGAADGVETATAGADIPGSGGSSAARTRGALSRRKRVVIMTES